MIGMNRSHINFKGGIATLVIAAVLVLGLSGDVFALPKVSLDSCYDHIADNFQVTVSNWGDEGFIGYDIVKDRGVIDVGFFAPGESKMVFETREGVMQPYVKEDADDEWRRKSGAHQLSRDRHTKHGKLCYPQEETEEENEDENEQEEQSDSTAPVISSNVSGPTGSNGWYTGNVTINWNVNDPESEIQSTSGCETTTLTHNTNGTVATCTAVNEAGLSTSESVDIKISSSAPSVRAVLSGEEGQNGWFTGSVNINWEISNNGAPIASNNGCESTTLNNSRTITCSVTNEAGQTTSESVDIKISSSAPSVRAVLSGEAGQNGWFVSDVNVRWEITNSGAAVTSKVNCDPTTLANDTDGTTMTCTATNEAGQSATAHAHVKIDRTGPHIQLKNPGDFAIYVLNQPDIVIQWAVRDASSSITDINATQPTGEFLDTSEPGTHIFELSATDAAGNTTVLRHTYMVHYVIAPAGGERSVGEANSESENETAHEDSYLEDPIAGAGGSNGAITYEGQYAVGEIMSLRLKLADINGNVVRNAAPVLTIGRVVEDANGNENVTTLLETYTFTFDPDTEEYLLEIDTSGFDAGMYDLMISAGKGQFIQPDEGWDFTTVRIDLVE